MKIFWSWQSDTPGTIGRHFVRDALKAAVAQLKTDPDIVEPLEREVLDGLHVDHDRQGVPGSPDLVRTILDKIDAASVVVCDVTTAGIVKSLAKKPNAATPGKKARVKKLINSNVAIELGYALRAHGEQNLLMVLNTYYGGHDELPFDLRQKSTSLTFHLPPDATKDAISIEAAGLQAKLVFALRPYLGRVDSRRETVGEILTRTQRALNFAQARDVFLAGDAPIVARKTFATVADTLDKQFREGVVQVVAGEIKRNETAWAFVSGDAAWPSLKVYWHYHFINTLEEAELRFELWRGHPNWPGLVFWKDPTPSRTVSFEFDLLDFDQPGYIYRDTQPRSFTPAEIGDHITRMYLEALNEYAKPDAGFEPRIRFV
jgi:hypothetical protein